MAGHEHILGDEGSEKGVRIIISGGVGNTDKRFKPGSAVIEVTANKSSYKLIEL